MSASRPFVVAHLTPHHHPFDPRIFAECRSLAQAGFDVVLVAPHTADEVRDGVRLRAIRRSRNRFERVTRTAFSCLRRAVAERPALFHLHDPEMILWGVLLRLLGRPVIYDVHEDYRTAALVRPWIPTALRRMMAALTELLLALARHSFHVVIAERYYARIFPNATAVLNYARTERMREIMAIDRSWPAVPRLLYTGSVTESRGALQHARLATLLPEGAELWLVGHCGSKPLFRHLHALAGSLPQLKLLIDAENWIPHEQIVEFYRQPWTAGLALFPDTPHYREKELSKFFEYMAAGLPVICSDFPVWRALVQDNRVGLCVDPDDPQAAAAAVRWLVEHPEEARAMGERGRALVRSRFNWESQAEKLIALYRRLLAAEAAS